jgi:hypothetical protein
MSHATEPSMGRKSLVDQERRFSRRGRELSRCSADNLLISQAKREELAIGEEMIAVDVAKYGELQWGHGRERKQKEIDLRKKCQRRSLKIHFFENI